MKLVQTKEIAICGDSAESQWNLASSREKRSPRLAVWPFNHHDLDVAFTERETRVSQPVGSYAD
jgi:hypothetical protein